MNRCWDYLQMGRIISVHVDSNELWVPVFRLRNAADPLTVLLWPRDAFLVSPFVAFEGLVIVEVSGVLKGEILFCGFSLFVFGLL